MTPARKPVTLAQLRKAAPKGCEVREDRCEDAIAKRWYVQVGEGGFVPLVQTCHVDRQTARRMCLAALREMKEAHRG